jgi:type IV pilus assembly protein PilM
VANQQIVVRQIELPRIEDPDELDAAVRFQAAEAVPMPLDEAVLDSVMLSPAISPDGISQMRVMVVAARRTMVEMLVEAARSAGLKPVGVDLDSFALIRALAMPDPPSDSAVVHCHLAGIVNLAIAVGEDCLFTRPLATDWAGAGLDIAPALAEEVRLSVDAYSLSPDARPVTTVSLSGPGAELEGLADQLKEATGLEVSVAPPLGMIAPLGLPPGEDPRRYTVATGLALGAAA